MKLHEQQNRLPCDAEGMIPHQPPMLLVKELIEKKGDTFSIIDAEIPLNGPFVMDGKLLPEYYIEVMAQAIAASDGFPREEGKKPAKGFLTGVDGFSWHDLARPGDRIRIFVRKTFEFGSAFIFSGEIMSGSTQIAAGELKIWKVEE